MTRFADDWLNPIVVKEVRQGLRTRVFGASFGLLLAGSVLVSLVAFAARDGTGPLRDGGVGVAAFGAYFAVFAIVGFFVLPITTYRAFVAERASDTWPMLQMTGLAPRRILRGKIASALVQAALYASAVAPFMLFSYFLEGIGLFTILASMAAAFVWQAFLATVAVCGAALADGRFSRGLVGAALGLFLPMASFMLVGSLGSAFVVGRVGVSFDLRVVVVPIWFFATLSALLFEAAAAKLASSGTNTAIGPRIAISLHLATIAALWWVPAGNRDDPGMAAYSYAGLMLFLFGTFAASENEPALGRPARWRAPSLLQPGAVNGFRFTILAAIVLALVFWIATGEALAEGSRVWRSAVATGAWVPMYLAIPIVIARGLLPRVFGDAPRQQVLTAALAFGAFVLGAMVSSPWSEQDDFAYYLNPFEAGRNRASTQTLLLMPLVSIAVCVLAERVLAHRAREAAELRAARLGGESP